MKKIATVFGVLFLAAVVASPAFARGQGRYGGGGYGDYRGGGQGDCWRGDGASGDYRGGGQGYCRRADSGTGALTAGERDRLAELNRAFDRETDEIRGMIRYKSSELNAVLDSPSPDVDKARALQTEINDLRAKKADARLAYQIETRKLGVEDRYAGGYGRGKGKGNGYGKGRNKGKGMGYGNGSGGYGRGGGACRY